MHYIRLDTDLSKHVCKYTGYESDVTCSEVMWPLREWDMGGRLRLCDVQHDCLLSADTRPARVSP